MGRLKGSRDSDVVAFARRHGNGPWRILPDCEALQHNTITAARGDKRRLGSAAACVCPRATALLAEDRARHAASRRKHGKADEIDRSAIQLAARRRKSPLMDIGHGPWMVLDSCPAVIHNVLRAARGHVLTGSKYSREKCVCPRAIALNREYLARQSYRSSQIRLGLAMPDGRQSGIREAMTGMPPNRGGGRQSGIAAVLADMPDLHGGLCVGDADAIRVFDAASASLDEGSQAISRAKQICAGCPLKQREACGEWAMKGERTPGDWGGVYGGMSPRDRIQKRYGFTSIGGAA